MDLPCLVAKLGVDDAARFARIYAITMGEGRMRLPEAMAPWVERTFGPVASVESQRIVRVSNIVTGEGTLFNGLRARRPVRAAFDPDDAFEQELRDDPWADPLLATPEDPFGRLSGEHGVTAANVAKYEAAHGVIVFAEPNPLAFTRESIAGHVELVNRWLTKAHEYDPSAVYPYVLWNCLWRAGGSIVHGHAQVQLARGRHYGKIERLRRDALAYRAVRGVGYFDDLVAVHQALGLASAVEGVRVLAHLTPLKEREVLLVGNAFDRSLALAIHETVGTFRDALGVRSFNLGVLLPPLAAVEESWEGFPTLVRIVDRGDLGSRTSDIGGMELFAESVVASDPFALHRALSGAGE